MLLIFCQIFLKGLPGHVYYDGCVKFTCEKKRRRKYTWVEGDARQVESWSICSKVKVMFCREFCCSYLDAMYPPGEMITSFMTTDNCSQVSVFVVLNFWLRQELKDSLCLSVRPLQSACKDSQSSSFSLIGRSKVSLRTLWDLYTLIRLFRSVSGLIKFCIRYP